MEVQRDFRKLLEIFNKHDVEYLIVGGYALAFHCAPRYTGDLDIFIRPDSMNAQRVMSALEDFGFESVGLTEADFERPDNVVQLGVPPVRVDIVTSLTGISWKSAFEHRVQGRYGDI